MGKKDNLPKMGDRIIVPGRLFRREKHDDKGWIKYWVMQDFPSSVEVMVIGVRNLTSGEVTENGSFFHGYKPELKIKALLVVEHMNSNPFYVPTGNYEQGSATI